MEEPILNAHNKEEYPPMHTAEHILNGTMVRMFDQPLKYDLGKGVEAFSTQRDAVLPYEVTQGHQVHGSRVAIGVRTADCVPVLIYDSVKRIVAAVHAGWKGTVLHISHAAIEAMKQEFGCAPADMKAVIGPSIGPDSFQVGGVGSYTTEAYFSARREGVQCGRIINAIKLI